jgi:hypothetical protein
MKYHIVLDSKPTHCLYCHLRDSETDGCVLQREADQGECISPREPCIEFEDWEHQMEHCPIVAIDAAPDKEQEKITRLTEIVADMSAEESPVEIITRAGSVAPTKEKP